MKNPSLVDQLADTIDIVLTGEAEAVQMHLNSGTEGKPGVTVIAIQNGEKAERLVRVLGECQVSMTRKSRGAGWEDCDDNFRAKQAGGESC